MTAQIGDDGLDLLGDPRPELLTEVARIQPHPGGEWANLEERLGFRSTQRLRIGDLADSVVVATWPAELARQARYLYGDGLGSALVAAAIERGWTVVPSPHIAYFTASPTRRLYMRPSVAPLDYAACWESADGFHRIGGSYTREGVEHELWPWLKQRGFAGDGDDTVLTRFLDEYLHLPAQMRPGLRFRRVWTAAEVAELGSGLAEAIRNDFDAVFAVADEPALSSAELAGRRPASVGLGAPYRQVPVTELSGSRDPFSIDPGLVERACEVTTTPRTSWLAFFATPESNHAAACPRDRTLTWHGRRTGPSSWRKSRASPPRTRNISSGSVLARYSATGNAWRHLGMTAS